MAPRSNFAGLSRIMSFLNSSRVLYDWKRIKVSSMSVQQISLFKNDFVGFGATIGEKTDNGERFSRRLKSVCL